MEIYLAGENGKWRILSELFRGGKMEVYLAGGFTGNLAPEWKKIAIEGGRNV